MKDIEVCEELKVLLSLPKGRVLKNSKTSFLYDPNKIFEHIKTCVFCQESFKSYYDQLEIPFIAKTFIDNFIFQQTKK